MQENLINDVMYILIYILNINSIQKGWYIYLQKHIRGNQHQIRKIQIRNN